MKRIKSIICLICVLCACLSVFSGCSSAQKTTDTTQTTAAPDEPEQTETQAVVEEQAQEPLTETDIKGLLGIGLGQQVQRVDGIEVVSGWVERVTGNMYTPSSAGGFFTVNGTIAESSEIVITFHPVGVLRYTLSLQADAPKTVKAEIQVYKQGKMLVSCSQEEMQLKEGANDVDVCIDTGEDAPCDGLYTLQLYIDDVLVKENDYEA